MFIPSFLNGPIPASFTLFSSFKQLSLPMIEFVQWISGVRSAK